MHTRLILLCALAFSVAGFGKEPTADDFAKACTVRRDDFRKVTDVDTPLMECSTKTEGEFKKISMTAERNDGESMRFFILMRTIRTPSLGWARWKTANDENGKEFEMDEQISDVQKRPVMVLEVVRCLVTREYLDSVKEKGVKWRIYGSPGISTDIALTPALITGLLKRADELK